MVISNIGFVFESTQLEDRFQKETERRFLRFSLPKTKIYGQYCRMRGASQTEIDWYLSPLFLVPNFTVIFPIPKILFSWPLHKMGNVGEFARLDAFL